MMALKTVFADEEWWNSLFLSFIYFAKNVELGGALIWALNFMVMIFMGVWLKKLWA